MLNMARTGPQLQRMTNKTRATRDIAGLFRVAATIAIPVRTAPENMPTAGNNSNVMTLLAGTWADGPCGVFSGRDAVGAGGQDVRAPGASRAGCGVARAGLR